MIVPRLKTGPEYYRVAEEASTDKYGSLFARRIHERWLWVSIHAVVAVLGLGLGLRALSALRIACCSM